MAAAISESVRTTEAPFRPLLSKRDFFQCMSAPRRLRRIDCVDTLGAGNVSLRYDDQVNCVELINSLTGPPSSRCIDNLGD